MLFMIAIMNVFMSYGHQTYMVHYFAAFWLHFERIVIQIPVAVTDATGQMD